MYGFKLRPLEEMLLANQLRRLSFKLALRNSLKSWPQIWRNGHQAKWCYRLVARFHAVNQKVSAAQRKKRKPV